MKVKYVKDITQLRFESWLERLSMHRGEWKEVFLWAPIIQNYKIYWLCKMYKAANYDEGGYEYKTKRQFIIDELSGKN